MCHLKGLDLSGVTMMDFGPEIIHVILEQVAATIQELNLEECGITESQHESILCPEPLFKLGTFILCGNVLSGHPGEASESHQWAEQLK